MKLYIVEKNSCTDYKNLKELIINCNHTEILQTSCAFRSMVINVYRSHEWFDRLICVITGI